MSAIVGIHYLNGRPVDRRDVERMTTTLSHRGPDGAGVWCEGTNGLGHRMLWTTPESLAEKLPFVCRSGDLVITADVRLDNRSDLIAALGLADGEPGKIADSELILAAYEKWGEHCPEQLLGDFAFILWDRRRQVLFGARDHFGIKPLYYYYQASRIFACASEIKALFCVPEVPRRLNEVRVADYLGDVSEDKTSTFYQDILRLPPAHSITVSKQSARLHCYWSLDASSELPLRSDEEYATTYRDLFTEAVGCRLRSAFPVGSHLSGGLDSSSITCVTRKLLEQTNTTLHTLSNIFDDLPQCDERSFINEVLAQGGYRSHYVHADQSSPLADMAHVFRHQDEPAIGPNHFLPWELNRAASQAGVRVVLDGFDGDTTVSHGASRFSELAHAGEWKTFAQEADAISQHFKTSPLALLHAYGLPYLAELRRGQRWMTFSLSVNQINRYFQVSRGELFWKHGLKPLIPSGLLRREKSSRPDSDSILNPDFARQVGLKERVRARNGERAHPPRTVREEQWRTLTSGLFPWVLELSDRCASAFSIEVRHPFMDKRLIEFCLALPPEQKLHQGWSRIVMRRAMIGILPEAIRWRGGKTDMTPNFLRGLLTADRGAVEEVIFQSSVNIEKYVDIQALRQIYQRLIAPNKAKIGDAMAVWKATTLAYWLRYADFEASATAEAEFNA
jgi:asparagine synthase (glutamine-hydrolysing)